MLCTLSFLSTQSMHWGAVTTGAPPLEAVAGVTILLSLPLLSSLPIEKCFLSGFSRPWALIGLTTAEGGGQLVMVKDQTVVSDHWSHLKRSCATWGKENLHVHIFKVSLQSACHQAIVCFSSCHSAQWSIVEHWRVDFKDCQLHRPRPVTQFSSRSCKMVGESARESNDLMKFAFILW